MAFVPLLQGPPRHERILRSTSATSPRRQRRGQWFSLARSHPYGDGGIPTEVDWTGYDPEEMKAELAEAERRYKESQQVIHEGAIPWAIVMSADIIQWNNNLFKTSKEHGFDWNLEGVNVVRMAERTALRALPSDLAKLWVIRLGAEGLLTFSMGSSADSTTKERFMLAFEAADEAVRFVDQLVADGSQAESAEIPIVTLKSICTEGNLILGLVPQETLVSPMQFAPLK